MTLDGNMICSRLKRKLNNAFKFNKFSFAWLRDLEVIYKQITLFIFDWNLKKTHPFKILTFTERITKDILREIVYIGSFTFILQKRR